MTRRTLPNRRKNNTFPITMEGYKNPVLVTVGYFNDGTPAEVFVSGTKAGSMTDAVSRDAAILLSLALQHNVPLDTMKHAITRNSDGEASTVIGQLIDELSAEPPQPPEEVPTPRPPVLPAPAPAAAEMVQ